MKKQFLLKPLLTLALVMMCGNAWGTTTYKLVKVTEVASGNLYVFEQKGYVMISEVSSSALQTTVDYKTNDLTGTENYVWTLEEATNGFYIKSAVPVSVLANGYLNNTSSNAISLGNKGTSVFKFDFTGEVALISNTSNDYRFLGYISAESYAYKAYATSNINSYAHDITVYKLVEDDGTTISVTGVTLTESIELIEGKTSTLVATVAPAGATNKNVTWDSSDESVATVDADGKVTAVAEGTATITVKTVDGEFTDECTVTVSPKPSINANSVIIFNTFSSFSGSEYKTLDDYVINGTGGFQVTDCMLSSSKLQMKASSGELVSPVIKSKCGFDVYVTYTSEANMTLKIGSEDAVSDGSVLKASTNSTSASFVLTVGNEYATVEKIVILPKHNVIISSAKYATLCLPFNFTVPEGVTAYTGAATDDGVTLTAIDGVVPANTGVILYSETAGTYTFTGSADTPATLGTNDLVGVTEDTAIPNGSYILALDLDNTAKFFEINPTDNTLAANKAYLKLPEGVTPSNALAIRRGDAAGIENMKEAAPAVYIDLMGRKVANPTPGIYILGGKKVLVK